MSGAIVDRATLTFIVGLTGQCVSIGATCVTTYLALSGRRRASAVPTTEPVGAAPQSPQGVTRGVWLALVATAAALALATALSAWAAGQPIDRLSTQQAVGDAAYILGVALVLDVLLLAVAVSSARVWQRIRRIALCGMALALFTVPVLLGQEVFRNLAKNGTVSEQLGTQRAIQIVADGALGATAIALLIVVVLLAVTPSVAVGVQRRVALAGAIWALSLALGPLAPYVFNYLAAKAMSRAVWPQSVALLGLDALALLVVLGLLDLDPICARERRLMLLYRLGLCAAATLLVVLALLWWGRRPWWADDMQLVYYSVSGVVAALLLVAGTLAAELSWTAGRSQPATAR